MFKKSACLLVIAGMLAACGGGGGSSAKVHTMKAVDKNQYTTEQATMNEEDFLAALEAGDKFKIELYDDQGKLHIVNLSKDDVFITGVNDASWPEATWGDYGSTMAAVIDDNGRIGSLALTSVVETSLQDMQALADSSNPIATYSGEAVGMVGLSVDKEFGYGSSEFTVDFKNKKLEGMLTSYNNDPNSFADGVKINAKIKGSKFSGTANTVDGQHNAETYGQFAGPKASELHGYYQGKDIAGAYSASKN